jgi:hypothetical protein
MAGYPLHMSPYLHRLGRQHASAYIIENALPSQRAASLAPVIRIRDSIGPISVMRLLPVRFRGVLKEADISYYKRPSGAVLSCPPNYPGHGVEYPDNFLDPAVCTPP